MRGRYEGVWNVVRFNAPKYVLGVVVVVLACIGAYFFAQARPFWIGVAVVALVMIVVPLVATHIVYDRSDLYRMPWLSGQQPRSVINLNAGFDESSAVLQQRFSNSNLRVIDLFDPVRCTEPSIVRARKAYPPYPGTVHATGSALPTDTASIDLVVAFLSLHEVRKHADRVAVFVDIKRTLVPDGRLVVTEHLCDLSNTLVFTFGVPHFHTRATWLHAFHEAGLRIVHEQRTAGLITTFILQSA